MDERIKSLHDFEASLAVISSNEKSYCDGNLHAYRPVAVELRKLLCDTQAKADISLIKRIYPQLKLHPLSGMQNRTDEYTDLYIPGRMSFNGRGGSKIQLFNELAPSLILDEWLQQKLFDYSTTIKDFIRSVADKEGAHSDKTYNAILSKTKSVLLPDDTLAAKTILAIGRYLIKTIALHVVNDNIAKIAVYITTEYEKLGRGMAILKLSDYANHSSQGVSLKYEPVSIIEGYFKYDSKKLQQMQQTISSYDPLGFFLILIVDMNGEIWVYQQKMKTEKT